ncbi:MAG: ABC transporter permease, partial [Actinobacteria bacterium]|nr:ABC transporter permease [Actinomycetota bacterium]
WMQFLVNINPLGYLVDAERALFAGDFASSTVMAGVVAAAATAAVGLAVGIRAMGSSRV